MNEKSYSIKQDETFYLLPLRACVSTRKHPEATLKGKFSAHPPLHTSFVLNCVKHLHGCFSHVCKGTAMLEVSKYKGRWQKQEERMYNSRNSQSKQIKLHTAAADTYTRRGGWVLGSTHIKSPVSFANSTACHQGQGHTAVLKLWRWNYESYNIFKSLKGYIESKKGGRKQIPDFDLTEK